MHARCSGCGELFEREPGLWFGAVYINLGLTFGVTVAGYTLTQAFTSVTTSEQIGRFVFPDREEGKTNSRSVGRRPPAAAAREKTDRALDHPRVARPACHSLASWAKPLPVYSDSVDSRLNGVSDVLTFSDSRRTAAAAVMYMPVAA